MLLLRLAAFASVLGWTTAQLTSEELEPLLSGLQNQPNDESRLQKRVPLSTNDPTVAPLIDLQVFAPPSVPRGGSSCRVQLLKHTFGDGSYNAPAIAKYLPPTINGCGEIGKWAAISMNLTVYSVGTQYDRLGAIYLSHTEIWRTSSAEPTKTGTIWTTLKDVTHFAPLFAKEGDLMMDFSNIVAPDLLLDGVFDVTLTATFYAPTSKFPTPKGAADLIIPLSNLSPTLPNFFAIADDAGAVTNVTLPESTLEAYVEIFCSGNSAEEFWYSNTPDEYLAYFPDSTGLLGKGPWREVQVLVDDQLAGVIWPYAVIYTGGVTPSNWRPLTAYGAYDAPTYWIDITPFLPKLLDGSPSHTIRLRAVGQGTDPTFNSNWYVSGSVHLRQGTGKTTGTIIKYRAPPVKIVTTGKASAGNETISTKVTAKRSLTVESRLVTSEGTKNVVFTQSLDYINLQRYGDKGWLQWVNQTTTGSTISTHNGVQQLRDAFIYPLDLYSNYSLYTQEFGAYGSQIHQTYTRALQPPLGQVSRTIYSDQHAEGEIGMDNWPGLRHAINGTGATSQTFAYLDGHGETYYRDIAAKNDGWAHDNVWGTLKDANGPLPDSQIFGPGGGPGFRKRAMRKVTPRV